MKKIKQYRYRYIPSGDSHFELKRLVNIGPPGSTKINSRVPVPSYFAHNTTINNEWNITPYVEPSLIQNHQ
jgi:hypothetical protein